MTGIVHFLPLQVKIDFQVVTVRPSAIRSNALAIWQSGNAILICASHAEHSNMTSVKLLARMSQYNEDFVSIQS